MPIPISRRRFAALMLTTGAAARFPVIWAQTGKPASADRDAFLHPGMLHTSDDLRRMREGVQARKEPVFSGFERLREHPQSQASYVPAGASAEVGRNPNLRFGEFDRDCNAAYQCALMGCLTGEAAYWQLSMRILDNWASTLQRITGADAILCAGLGGFKLINAAELVRWCQPGWAADGVSRFAAFLRATILPVLDNFAPFANGNWDTAAMKTLMACAVFLDDHEIFERVLVYYNHGCGDGRLTNYIYANGQCQESGRDQQHTQLGLAHMGDCCEIAWNQGLDLYGCVKNRLLLGFEYTARYELGEDVPFQPDIDRTGKYRHAVISPRSALRPVYEQIFNHYVRRRGMAAPWTEKAAAAVRPEGAGFQADHTGFGTLLYSRENVGEGKLKITRLALGGLYAENAGSAIRLSWVPPSNGRAVEVLRRGSGSAVLKHSPLVGVSELLDATVKAGESYTYDFRLEGDAASAVRAVAGLPAGWRVLPKRGKGETFFDGSTWRLASGNMSLSQTFCAAASAKDKHQITARLLPEFASSQLRAGLVLAGIDGRTLHTLLLEPVMAKDAERGGWALRLRQAGAPGEELALRGERALSPPQIQYGRVETPLWMRLRWGAEGVTAESSEDGVHWQMVGTSADGKVSACAGLTLTSGIDTVSAQVSFDNVELE